MDTVHPAWRFVLALRSRKLDPRDKGLPSRGGRELWNETSMLLSNIIEAKYAGGKGVEGLFEHEEHGQKYRYLDEAYRMFDDKKRRVFLETLLMCKGGENEAWLTSEYGVAPEVLSMYKEAFFDVSVLGSAFGKGAYTDSIGDPQEKEFKEGWVKGPASVKRRMGFNVVVDARVDLSDLLGDAIVKFKASGNNSKESIKWCELALKLGFKLIDDKSPENFMEEFRLALKLKPAVFEAMPGVKGRKESDVSKNDK